MSEGQTIASNITGLAYAEEENICELGVSPNWIRLQPNSYSDFGGEITTVTPNPINPSRQRRKGVTTDLEASGGFNQNVSFYNIQDMLQSVMFADFRRKGSEPVTAIDHVNNEYDVASTAGFRERNLIRGFGFSNAENNGPALGNAFVVEGVVANTSIEVSALVEEADIPDGAYIQVIGQAGLMGDLDVDVSGSFPAITSTTLDFTTLGLVVGQWIFVGSDSGTTGFSNAANNGFKRVRSVTARRLTLDKSVQTMVTEDASTRTIHIYFGDVLRNETGSLIKRRSYHLERTLGSPENSGQDQSEILIGQIPNEFTINIPTAELVNVDFAFLGLDHLQRTAAQGPLQSDVSNPQAANVWNTTSDFSRIKMSSVSDTDEAPDALFAFVTEATININNNLTSSKAVGVLGAFDVTAGTFTVSGSLTAYFSDVASIQAVRNNSDITLDMVIVKENQGVVLDFPLMALGDGRLNVEQDTPITIPLSFDAATGEDITTGMDHTALFTFFAYLPDAAE